MALSNFDTTQKLAFKYINSLPSFLDFEDLSITCSPGETEDDIITKHYAEYFQPRKDSGISGVSSANLNDHKYTKSNYSASIYSKSSDLDPVNQESQQQVKNKSISLDSHLNTNTQSALTSNLNLIINQQKQQLYRNIEQKEDQTENTILNGPLNRTLRSTSIYDSNYIINQQRQQIFNDIKQKEEQNKIIILDGHLDKILGSSSTSSKPTINSNPVYNQKRQQIIKTLRESQEQVKNETRGRTLKRTPALCRSKTIKHARELNRSGTIIHTPTIRQIKTNKHSKANNNVNDKQQKRKELGEALGNLDPYWNELTEAEREEIYREVEKEENVQRDLVNMSNGFTSSNGRKLAWDEIDFELPTKKSWIEGLKQRGRKFLMPWKKPSVNWVFDDEWN